MALPPIEIDVRADTAQAEAGLARVGNAAQTAGIRTNAGANAAASGVGRLGAASGQMRGQVQNASFQLQDMIVQLQMGTRWTTVMAQQLPQLAGGFGAVGAAIGVLAAVGFTGIGLLSTYLSNAGDEAEELADRVEDATSRIQELRMEVRELRLGVSPEELALMDAIAEAQERVNRAARMAAAPREETAAIGRADLAVEQAKLTELQAQLVEYKRLQDGVEALKNSNGEVITQFDIMEAAIMGAGGSLASLIPTAQTLRDIIAQTADAARALGIANIAAQQSQLGRGGAGPGGPMSAADRFIASTGGTFAAGEEAPSLGGGGGGGVGAVDTTAADLAALEKKFMSETELIQATYDERHELLVAAREQQLLTEEEYNQRLIDIENDKNKKLIDLDAWKHGTTLDQLEYGLGEAASALAGGNAQMLAISKKFAQAEAIVNAGRAFAQVAADPSLPWYAKIPAAVGVASAIASFANSSGIGGGGSAGAASAVEAEAARAPRREVNLTLVGDQGFSRAQIVQLAEALSDSGDDGQQLVNITGRR